MTYDFLKDYEHISTALLMRKLKISFELAEKLYEQYATDEMKQLNLDNYVDSLKRKRTVVK